MIREELCREEGSEELWKDVLQDHRLSDETLAFWSGLEAEARHKERKQDGSERAFDSRVREMRTLGVMLLRHLAERSGLDRGLVAQAVAILDVFCYRSLAPDKWGSIPSISVGIYDLLCKVSCPMDSQSQRRHCEFRTLSAWFRTASLKMFGQAVDPIPETLGEVQHRILTSLNWHLSIPTAVSWAGAFFDRLFCAVTSSFLPMMESASVKAEELGVRLLGSTTVFDAPQRQLGTGLMVLGLVWAGAVPGEALLPPDWSFEAWASVLGRAFVPGVVGRRATDQERDELEEERLLRAVVRCTGRTRTELSLDLLLVLEASGALQPTV